MKRKIESDSIEKLLLELKDQIESSKNDDRGIIEHKISQKHSSRQKPRHKKFSYKVVDNTIQATHNTPLVKLSRTGKIRFEGRAYPEDTSRFFDEILIWIIEYVQNPAEITFVEFKFEYVNDGTMKFIMQILRELLELVRMEYELRILWYYESIDEDMKELGFLYSEILDIPIRLIPVEV